MNPIKQTDKRSLTPGWCLSDQHQLAIALLGAIAVVAVGVSYGWSAWSGEEVDIDQTPASSAMFQVDVNRAVVGELMAVPSVGPKMAQAIVDHRQRHGSFGSLEKLQEVPGIGPKKLEQLKKHLLLID